MKQTSLLEPCPYCGKVKRRLAHLPCCEKKEPVAETYKPGSAYGATYFKGSNNGRK